MSELDDRTFERIRSFCVAGDDLLDEGRTDEALEAYWSAWNLLPEPRTSWEAATWILAAIGDVNFRQGRFEAGRDSLLIAMGCPEAIGNPFLHLRLGQCQLELGETERAADELAQAFRLESEDLFEDEDPKYLEFVRSRLKERPGGI